MSWAGCENNQRSKDVMQETHVKKTLYVSQANLVANNKKEHAALLSNLKTQRGHACRTDVLDGVQNCTCVNNA